MQNVSIQDQVLTRKNVVKKRMIILFAMLPFIFYLNLLYFCFRRVIHLIGGNYFLIGYVLYPSIIIIVFLISHFLKRYWINILTLIPIVFASVMWCYVTLHLNVFIQFLAMEETPFYLIAGFYSLFLIFYVFYVTFK